ncbi:hypothetical protein ACJMK2_023108 [Sinanodonta woodiana]|uniref:ZU5 domain-containing protein n=1 Tax=Sinanodonta woodiana TaxID=1069815 RepID=A0ABD3T447_SINWO
MWAMFYLAVILFLPTVRTLQKKPEEEIRVPENETLCTDCSTKSQEVSIENSPVKGHIKKKKPRLDKTNLSELLQDCDWFTQYKNCNRLWIKNHTIETREKYKRKTKCGTIDTRSSICCKGKRYKKQYGNSTSCCGKYIYDSSRKKCCWDTVKVKHGEKCCKSLKSDTDCYSCKHGIIKARLDAKISNCCKGVIYNLSDVGRDMKCCGNEVHRRDIDCPNPSLMSSSNQSSSIVAAIVALSCFLYKRKVKRHKTAGNHTINVTEPENMSSKDTFLDIVADKETTLTKGNNCGNQLLSIHSRQYVACSEIHCFSGFPDRVVQKKYISCLNDGETLNSENYFKSSDCMEYESSVHFQNMLASISSKDRTQETTHEQNEMLNTFGDDRYSHATESELNDPLITSDCEEVTIFVKECNARYSFSSVKSSISIVLSQGQFDGHTSDFSDEEYNLTDNTRLGDDFNHRHNQKIACHENNVSGELAKNVSFDARNLTASIWREIGSQTMRDNNTKKLNIFSEDWTLHGTFDVTGGVLRGETTSVELIIPQGLFDNFSPSEVYGSVYTKISALRRKFDLSENEEIVGPGVEFWLPSITKFNKYAIVKIPYFGDDDISVYWFGSDSGSNEKQTLQKLEPKSKYNNANQDMYCEIGGDGFVYIYTKHFSGFLCTRCTCSGCPTVNTRELTLYGVVFGSFKCIDEGRQVRIRLFIADGKAKLDDFLQEYVSQESSKGRELLETTEIGLVPDVLESEDILRMRLEVMDDEDSLWINKKKRSGLPLKPDVQHLKLSKIVRCCRQDDSPAFVEWFLENDNSGAKRKFQCFIDIDVTVTNNRDVPTSESTSSCSTIIIDDLRMQKNEEEEVKQCEKVRGILARMLDVERADMFLQEFRVDVPIKLNRERVSQGHLETVLLQCQKKYGPGLFLAKTESIIRKLNIPRVLEEIGSYLLHECVSGKAEFSSIASSQPVLLKTVGGCGGGEDQARAELSHGYPISSGPMHIPIQASTMEHESVRDYVHPMNQASVEQDRSESDDENMLVLKL